MLNFTQRYPADFSQTANFSLTLTADDRTRSRHYFETDEGQGVYLRLPRGTVLQHGDLLRSEDGQSLVRILAKPEPVMTVTAATPLALLKATYHLGNRHVSLEVTETYLRLAPDPVLKTMLERMGLHIIEEIVPFQPEAGAYGHSHSHEPESVHTHSEQQGN